MADNLENIARVAYREWKKSALVPLEHPDAELLAGFLEDKLTFTDKDAVQSHLLCCDQCAECISVQLKIQPHLSLDVPLSLLEKVKKLAQAGAREGLLEISVMLKEKVLEIIHTTGDVLFGQELVPAPLLRSRKINEFKEEISILKDLRQVRISAKIQNNNGRSFDLAIMVKSIDSQENAGSYRNLRITLIKDGLELESYINDSGSCFFENIPPADYTVEVSRQGERMAVVDLKVKA